MLTTEMLEKRAQRAQKRRVQAKKKVEENKKQTIERLLKKQDVKNKGNKVWMKGQKRISCLVQQVPQVISSTECVDSAEFVLK